MKEKNTMAGNYAEQKFFTPSIPEDKNKELKDSLAREIMGEIRKIAFKKGVDINDEKGMLIAVEAIKNIRDSRRYNVFNWDEMFSTVNASVEKEIASLKLQGSGQEVIEKIVRTKKVWEYIADKVLGRKYMFEAED